VPGKADRGLFRDALFGALVDAGTALRAFVFVDDRDFIDQGDAFGRAGLYAIAASRTFVFVDLWYCHLGPPIMKYATVTVFSSCRFRAARPVFFMAALSERKTLGNSQGGEKPFRRIPLRL
jgi:hypothetical protein